MNGNAGTESYQSVPETLVRTRLYEYKKIVVLIMPGRGLLALACHTGKKPFTYSAHAGIKYSIQRKLPFVVYNRSLSLTPTCLSAFSFPVPFSIFDTPLHPKETSTDGSQTSSEKAHQYPSPPWAKQAMDIPRRLSTTRSKELR